MLITRWNEVPVLALKSNYLDHWPNDWTIAAHLKHPVSFHAASVQPAIDQELSWTQFWFLVIYNCGHYPLFGT